LKPNPKMKLTTRIEKDLQMKTITRKYADKLIASGNVVRRGFSRSAFSVYSWGFLMNPESGKWYQYPLEKGETNEN